MVTHKDTITGLESSEVIRVADGNGCCEIVWLPSREEFVWSDTNTGVGHAAELWFVYSEEEGEESGMNANPGLIAGDFEFVRCLWVYDLKPEEVADDAEVWKLSEGGLWTDVTSEWE